jgi:ribosome recycling factor
MSSIQQIIKDSRTSMERALENTRKEFSSIRTGKASSTLLDTVRVEAYGQTVPISQVASVSAPEPRMLTVTPWDRNLSLAIEKAIRDADLGLNPASQGALIRVPVPALNEERRRDLVKILHKLAEEGRIAIRHARSEGRDKLKKVEHVSEDDVKHGEKDLQKAHDDFMQKVESMLSAKEAEVLEV